MKVKGVALAHQSTGLELAAFLQFYRLKVHSKAMNLHSHSPVSLCLAHHLHANHCGDDCLIFRGVVLEVMSHILVAGIMQHMRA